jgi:hypothetical protein
LFVLFGCGGNGSGSVGEDFMDRLVSAFNSSNVDRLDQVVSDSFYNNCNDKFDILSQYEDEINSGFRYHLEVVDVFNEQVDGNFAQFTARLRDRTDGSEDTGLYIIRREGGTWRLYGNQDCNATATKPKTKSPNGSALDWSYSK